MILEDQLNESSSQSAFPQGDGHVPSSNKDMTNRSDYQGDTDEKGNEDENDTYFIAKVWVFLSSSHFFFTLQIFSLIHFLVVGYTFI